MDGGFVFMVCGGWVGGGGVYCMKTLILQKNYILWGFGYHDKTTAIRTMRTMKKKNNARGLQLY